MNTTRDFDGERESRAALAKFIENFGEEILDRWMTRLRCQVAPGVAATPIQLRDAMPHYLERLAEALRRDEPSLPKSGAAIWTDVASEHALTRVRLGFDVEQLVHEFVLLRQVLSEVAAERNIGLGGPESTRIADLTDAAISVAVRSYVEARDYAARRKEAEHVAFITHELRGPLSTVKLVASQLRKVPLPDGAHLWDVLGRNVNRLESLVGSVLQAERLESGAVDPQFREMELGELLSQPLADARMAADAKGLAFHAEYDGQILVNVDPELTTSAVANLLENAVKYTDLGEVQVVVEAADRELRLHVRDNCPGLSEAELKTIFEPFERGHTKKPGSGLGLAIVRRAIEAQGGTVAAESSSERGCHFWMTIPRVSH